MPLHRPGDALLTHLGLVPEAPTLVVTLASIKGIDLGEAAKKYSNGCPRCGATPCGCAKY